jgi:2-polyprenyl-3-methyl-5-hydroxy-6-metoxy-1,4-benzoquinol methylase
MTTRRIFPGTDRHRSWGERYELTLPDRFGIWLSAVQIRRRIGSFKGLYIADIGCGYHAAFVRSVLDEVERATIVDLSLSDELTQHPKIDARLGLLPETLQGIAPSSLDVVLCNNVLEHLWQPVATVREVCRMLRPGGSAFFNVPSWRGKFYLEALAFRLKITAADEIDDHKAYYDERELWRLVVEGGFKPKDVVVRRHKFGLNTFAICKKS